MPSLDRLLAKRYVQPLREGGSLPAIVDTDSGLFVTKFRGAGQGPKALVAELIVAGLATALDLPVPEIAIIDIPPPFGRSEPDPEIQDLLRASHGTNFGIRYLDGAFNFELGAAGHLVSTEFATRLVWLDALVTNPDRTHRNPNLLVWERKPWLIDHGAALYAHHDWARVDEERIRAPFGLIADHVLLASSEDPRAVDEECTQRMSEGVVERILRSVPDELLEDERVDPDASRERYASYLHGRLEPPRAFAEGIEEARKRVLEATPRPLSSRR
ncbi:MAG: aminotransferase class I and II [Gemmatimonas sp.]|nr:aminotransferase class I and II [Gemmatimonas sp.]